MADTIYDPNSEPAGDVRNAALHWELLRRNTVFRKIADQWASDPKYRFEYARSEDYHHQKVHFPRCALDWMISVEDRLDVARRQIAEGRWFRDERFNFGPIIAKLESNPLDLKREKMPGAVSLRPMPGRHHVLSINQSWPATPPAFRTQFTNALGCGFPLVFLTEKLAGLGKLLLWAAARLQRGDAPEKLPELIQQLAIASDHLRPMAEFHHVVAIPNGRVPTHVLDEHLARIRSYCVEQGMVDDRFSRNKSWLGTAIAWHWFLEAESRGLDIHKGEDIYELARLYSLDLQVKKYSDDIRSDAKVPGFSTAKPKGMAISNRRKVVKEMIQQIVGWRDEIYPPARWIRRLKSEAK